MNALPICSGHIPLQAGRLEEVTTMTREARVVLPGAPHHITQRGIRRSNVFVDDDDHLEYLGLFKQAARQFGLRICAYCLMTNHVHFVAIPERQESIWRTFHRCHSIYAMKFNEKYGLSGHLWQGRPFSCVLDETHFWAAIRYVELNPVRAGMVTEASRYRWSSAVAHCGFADDPVLDPDWPGPDAPSDWGKWLTQDEALEITKHIRTNTITGRPCGDTGFMQLVEQRIGRLLSPKKRGPKAKCR
jgi:putative transposase